MTGTYLAAIVGSLLSLLFSYFPKLKDWYAKLDGYGKRFVMLLLLILVAAAVFGISCAHLGDIIQVEITCDTAGAWGLVRAVIAALAANQATFLISPKSKQRKRK